MLHLLTSDDTPGTAPDITPGNALEALRNERRRHLITYLARHHPPGTSPVPARELAEHIASIETGEPPGTVPTQPRKRVYIALIQCHLPKLDDLDGIDYRPGRKTVTTTSSTELLAELTDHIETKCTS